MTTTPAPMRQDILRLSGRVTDGLGRALPGLRMAVVDADPVLDDLLAVGFSDDDGGFRLSFTRAEFNQDVFEREVSPDLYIVFSALQGEAFVAVHREVFARRAFANGQEDLGTVRIDSWQDAPVFLGDQLATPGFRRAVLRLKVDNAIIEHCLEEIAPLVEQLTQCRGLLDDLQFELHEHMGVAAPQSQGSVDLHPAGAWLLGNSVYADFAALYDPARRVVHVNLGWARRQALDGLKVALGHELVHVAQYKSVPELAAQHRRLLRELADAGNAAALPEDPERARQLRDFMTNLEGYASYIENDHLRRHYTCAFYFDHVTPLQAALQVLSQRVQPELAALLAMKDAQYEDGRAVYQDLAADGTVPPFQATLPG